MSGWIRIRFHLKIRIWIHVNSFSSEYLSIPWGHRSLSVHLSIPWGHCTLSVHRAVRRQTAGPGPGGDQAPPGRERRRERERERERPVLSVRLEGGRRRARGGSGHSGAVRRVSRGHLRLGPPRDGRLPPPESPPAEKAAADASPDPGPPGRHGGIVRGDPQPRRLRNGGLGAPSRDRGCSPAGGGGGGRAGAP